MSGPHDRKFSPEYLSLVATYPERWWRWRNLPFWLSLLVAPTAGLWTLGWWHERVAFLLMLIGTNTFVAPLLHDIWYAHRKEVIRWQRRSLRKLRGEERQVLTAWLRNEMASLNKENLNRRKTMERWGFYSLTWHPAPFGHWRMFGATCVYFALFAIGRAGRELGLPLLPLLPFGAILLVVGIWITEWTMRGDAVARHKRSR